MSRLFWIGVGVAAGIVLQRKATETVRQVAPSGLASNLGDAVRELAGAVGSFGAEVRAGMNEREEELTEMVERRSGGGAAVIAPRRSRALDRSTAAGVRRARRAES